MTTIQLIRDEVAALTKRLSQEKSPEKIRALGEVLEKLNDQHERLERELLAE